MATRSVLLQADSNETNIWSAFKGEGVEIAYPHSHQVFGETSRELQVSMVDDTAPEMPAPTSRNAAGN
jgi:small-conductance mechanosensitive channel